MFQGRALALGETYLVRRWRAVPDETKDKGFETDKGFGKNKTDKGYCTEIRGSVEGLNKGIGQKTKTR